MLRKESAEASAIHRAPVEKQQNFWTGRFRDAGWQTERFIEGMKDSPFSYSQEVAQVRTDSWSKGRVVLVGDAAHCASPYSGMGISGGLVGAYVLAGEINRATCRPRWPASCTSPIWSRGCPRRTAAATGSFPPTPKPPELLSRASAPVPPAEPDTPAHRDRSFRV
ncbi:FAD-dependent monooxygenase [Streptomyces sp. NBC_01438]|uniref:FAD-dependent monooxygenase n=1 Tax=Streptomyces sp. NBC_01438 TaxID=2903866 RepID=UPI00352EAA09